VKARELGESCGQRFEDCRPTATCTAGVCVKGKKWVGEACTADPKGGESTECAEPFYCQRDPQPNTNLYSGHCSVRSKEGDACGPHTLCEHDFVCLTTVDDKQICTRPPAGSCSLGCATNTYCNPDTLLCQPGTLAKGALCHVSGQSNICAPGFACENQPVSSRNGSNTFAEICFPLPREGETCFGYACAVGLFCHRVETDGSLSLTCMRPHREHEACGADGPDMADCAEGLICRAHSCEKPCG
jgi:hypothetical protein